MRQKQKLFIMSYFSFRHNVFKKRLLEMRQNAGKSLMDKIIDSYLFKFWNKRRQQSAYWYNYGPHANPDNTYIRRLHPPFYACV